MRPGYERSQKKSLFSTKPPMEHPDSRQKPSKPRRAGTVLESIDESFAPLGPDTTDLESPPRAFGPIPGSSRREVVPSRFRPSLRPPMAILYAFDDGQDSAETVRIRVPSFVIGRAEGPRHPTRRRDVRPACRDRTPARRRRGIAGPCATLAAPTGRSSERRVPCSRWPGVAHRRDSLPLRRRASPALTASRPCPRGRSPAHDRSRPGRRCQRARPSRILGWSSLGPQGEASSFPLTEPETWLGRDPRQCSIVLDRPAVSPRHAVIRARRARTTG